MIKRLAMTRWGKSALAAFTALTLNSTKAYADNNPEIDTTPITEYSEPVVYESEQIPSNPQHIEPLDVIVETALAYGLRQFFHELGHYVPARALGYDARLNGPQIDGNNSSIAYTFVYHEKEFDTAEDILISSGGIGFTTVGNIMLTNYLANTDVNNSIRPFLGALSIMLMTDRYNYVTGAALFHFVGQKMFRDNDVSIVLDRIGIDKDAGYALLLASTIAEAASRWREFAYLYQTAIGNNPQGYEPSGLVFSILPGRDSVTLNAGGRF